MSNKATELTEKNPIVAAGTKAAPSGVKDKDDEVKVKNDGDKPKKKRNQNARSSVFGGAALDWTTKLDRWLQEKEILLYPGVNFIYDIFFDEAPTVESLKTILDNLGLMSALVLTMVISFPLGLTYESYSEIIERFSDSNVNSPYSGCSYDGYDLIKSFNANNTSAVYCLSSTLFVVILLLLYLVGTDMQDSSETIQALYWFWFRIPMTFALIFMTVGIGQTYTAYRYYIIMTMPNYDIEQHGCGDQSWNSNNPWNYNYLLYAAIAYLGIVVTIVSLSMSTRNRYLYIKRHPELDKHGHKLEDHDDDDEHKRTGNDDNKEGENGDGGDGKTPKNQGGAEKQDESWGYT